MMAMPASEIDTWVGQRMRQRRESLGISQARLARHLGLTFSQVQKYEKGTNRIGAGRLYLLAGFLGVSVQFFYDGLGALPAIEHMPEDPGTKSEQVSALGRAYLSIADPDARGSLLALVRSVAETAARPKLSAIDNSFVAARPPTSFADDRRQVRK
jgi:transcriptional regulator with XRE-family HTH domain